MLGNRALAVPSYRPLDRYEIDARAAVASLAVDDKLVPWSANYAYRMSRVRYIAAHPCQLIRLYGAG
jgi:hypothetical protein